MCEPVAELINFGQHNLARKAKGGSSSVLSVVLQFNADMRAASYA